MKFMTMFRKNGKYAKLYRGITQILAGLCVFNCVQSSAFFHFLVQNVSVSRKNSPKMFRGYFFLDTWYIVHQKENCTETVIDRFSIFPRNN